MTRKPPPLPPARYDALRASLTQALCALEAAAQLTRALETKGDGFKDLLTPGVLNVLEFGIGFVIEHAGHDLAAKFHIPLDEAFDARDALHDATSLLELLRHMSRV